MRNKVFYGRINKNEKIPDVYPWGTTWPPPSGAGNYSGQESASSLKFDDFRDNHPFTAPVGSCNANPFGLYDLGGNCWEFVEDKWNPSLSSRVLRGGSWYFSYRDNLLSSGRYRFDPAGRRDDGGFRCVVEVGSAR